MTLTAKVHNHTITLPPELVIAEGAEVQIIVPEVQSAKAGTATLYDTLKDFVGCVEGPEDLAAEHDHYAHGAPKRGGR